MLPSDSPLILLARDGVRVRFPAILRCFVGALQVRDVGVPALFGSYVVFLRAQVRLRDVPRLSREVAQGVRAAGYCTNPRHLVFLHCERRSRAILNTSAPVENGWDLRAYPFEN